MRFSIVFEDESEPFSDGLICHPGVKTEAIDAESFEAALLEVADRIRAFDLGGKTVVGLVRCVEDADPYSEAA